MAQLPLSSQECSTPALISGRGLFCERDDRILFSHLDFDFHPGDVVRITGPNGAGKSSLIRILLGLSASYEGQLLFNGQAMADGLYDFRNALLFLGHQVGVKANLTPEENLQWAVPTASQADIYQSLKQVGLAGYEDIPTARLSAGQQRRVALARLYLDDKKIWILDEPFTAIDHAGVLALEQTIAQHAAKGGLVILTTHHELSMDVVNLQLGASSTDPATTSGSSDTGATETSSIDTGSAITASQPHQAAAPQPNEPARNQPGMVRMLSALFSRDMLLAFRTRGELLNPLMFFLMVASLFPLAVSPDPKFLATIAPGVIWVGALLATLLSLDLIFKSDFEDGSLEQMLLLPQSTLLFVLVKVKVHWLVAGLPLALIAPLLGMMLALPDGGYPPLLLSLLLGTPILSLIGAIGAGLTVGLRKGGMLLPLLILPLYIPVLIFAASAVQAGVLGQSYQGHLLFMAAYLALTLVIAPLATSLALRISVAR